ncbi:MAG: transposase [Desulfuromonas sp.]|nr:transposase [Desulfuromonas sp.]
MPYHPDVHRRRSLRLSNYDYTATGAYFVTICAWQRECLFGEIVNEGMRLNDIGVIVQQSWINLPDHFPHVALDEFVVMPNHVHGIIVLKDNCISVASVGAQHAAPLHVKSTPHVMPGSLGAVIRSFKSAVTKHINIHRNTPTHPVWQRNYYEHVIRNDNDLAMIREYIAANPAKWSDDENYPGFRIDCAP